MQVFFVGGKKKQIFSSKVAGQWKVDTTFCWLA